MVKQTRRSFRACDLPKHTVLEQGPTQFISTKSTLFSQQVTKLFIYLQKWEHDLMCAIMSNSYLHEHFNFIFENCLA